MTPVASEILIRSLIDYAGLFPPARLPMDEAFSRFLRHRAGGSGWMMARFVCPAERLGELAPLAVAADVGGGAGFPVAILGSGGDEPPSFAEGLERDLETMVEFADRLGDRARLDVFEVKLPALGDPAETVDLVCDTLADAFDRTITPFLEVSLLGDWRDRLALAAQAAAVAGHEIDPGRRVGLKIRCGGLETAAFPSVEAVSAAIAACRDFEVPLKATQGLHHPIRHHDPTLAVDVHGFFNLLAAALLGREHRLDERALQSLVAESEPGAFELSGNGLRHGDLGVDVAGILSGRGEGFTSFGSCSFTEPRDDLTALGWL